MNPIILTQLSLEQLRQEFTAVVRDEIRNVLYQLDRDQKADDILTRKEVAQLLKVNLSTVHNWCKNGKLIPYGSSGIVRFYRSDVEKCLRPLNPTV